MSAFANTLGGALIFGMADDGQIGVVPCKCSRKIPKNLLN